MGFLSSLLPGLRDLRTPLTVGYAWIIGLWLILADFAGVKSVFTALADEFSALIPDLGKAGLLGALTVAAYLGGGLFMSDTATVSINRFEKPLLVDLFRRSRDRSAYTEDLFSYSLKRRYRVDDLDRVARFLGITPEDVEHWPSIKDNAPISKTLFAAFDSLDPNSLAIRLHIEKQQVLDQYDRLAAEAELRLALAVPMVFVALGVGLRSIWWAGVVLLLVTVLIYLAGDRKARSANGVLLTALVTNVIKEPQLDRARVDLTKASENARRLADDRPNAEVGDAGGVGQAMQTGEGLRAHGPQGKI